ncbi:ribulose-phosphate 3-epimerase [candidate division TM7 genomosp. GTL1]|nr:ribulose-phosphate 3-epimerase [candidate division TM7 genomosp. GTL1]
MAIICPTVDSPDPDPHPYRQQMERLQPFASRVHIDLMDGEFAPVTSIKPIQVWWPEGWIADIHLMFQRPLAHLETLISLHPNMVIIHAEAEGDLVGMLKHLQKLDIRAGVALLKPTEPKDAQKLIAVADHVLLFSGDLGHFGGQADLGILKKVTEVKAFNPNVDIGWDGGANASNVVQLTESGVDIINVGGAIASAEDPAAMYATLVSKIS